MTQGCARTLVLVRHGRAEGNDPRLPDFERRLDPRGQAEAFSIGSRLRSHALVAPRVIVSPARRTLETAQWIVEAMGAPRDALTVEDELYLAGVDTLTEVVRRAGGASQTLIVVGHNPGISDLVGWLTPASEPMSFETGEACIATLAISEWAELARGSATCIAREPGRAQ